MFQICFFRILHANMVGKNQQVDRKKPIKRLLDDFVIRNSSSLPQHQNQVTTAAAAAVPIEMATVEISSPTVLKPPSGDFIHDQPMLTTTSIGAENPTPSQRQFLSAATVLTNFRIDIILIHLNLPFYSFHSQSRAPESASSGFFYSPMYRWYFGHTPPNPRLNNPRLLEDYIDWYMNIYLQEEHIFHSVIFHEISVLFLVRNFRYSFSSMLVHLMNDDDAMNRSFEMKFRPLRHHHQQQQHQTICHRLKLSSQTNRTDISSFHQMFYSFLNISKN